MGTALVFYFIWASRLKCVFTSEVHFYEGCEGSLFPPIFFPLVFNGVRAKGMGDCGGGNSDGLLSVPDVSVRQHDRGSRCDCLEPPSGTVSTAAKGGTSVFTQNNQGPTLRAAQACY